MPVTDRATGRVVALIALLVLVGIALRGYLPGEDQAGDQPTDNTAAMIGVVTLLGAAVVIIVIAIVATLRQPPTPAPAGQPLPRRPSGERWHLRWRIVLIGLGVILVWLLVVVLLMQLSVRLDAPVPTDGAKHRYTRCHPDTGPATSAARAAGDRTRPVLVPVRDDGVHAGVPGRGHGDQRATAPAATHGRSRSARMLPRPTMTERRRRSRSRPNAGLAEMGDLSREPREAIIACYAAMEDALATAPGAVPQESDTPTEVLARAVEHHAIHAGTATDLVELFAEARFSPHVMNEGHRETAVRALQLVLAELRSVA